MSSMRNAVQRRNHKERSQPHERSKWGLLEKKKDYKLRAKDFNIKKQKLRILRRKVAERNEDEFYFGMVNSRTDKNGVHIADRGNKSLSMDVVRLLKTQDAGYLRVVSATERKKRERLEQELHFMEEGGDGEGDIGAVDINSGEISKKKHTVFVDNEEEVKDFDAARHFDTHPELLGRTFNRLRLGQLEGSETPEFDRNLNKKMARARELKYKELEARLKREAELKQVERELDEQRDRMGKHPTMGRTKSGKRFIVKERKK